MVPAPRRVGGDAGRRRPDTWQRIDVAIDESRQEPRRAGRRPAILLDAGRASSDGAGHRSRRAPRGRGQQRRDRASSPSSSTCPTRWVPVLVRVSYFPNWTPTAPRGRTASAPTRWSCRPTRTCAWRSSGPTARRGLLRADAARARPGDLPPLPLDFPKLRRPPTGRRRRRRSDASAGPAHAVAAPGPSRRRRARRDRRRHPLGTVGAGGPRHDLHRGTEQADDRPYSIT